MATRIGDRIKELRELKGESTRSLAEQVGVSHTTLQRIERGDTVDDQTLKRIATALDTTMDYLKGAASLRSQFAERLRLQPAGYRAMLLSDSAQRLRFLLQFLATTGRPDLTHQALTIASGLSLAEIKRAEQFPDRVPAAHVKRLAETIEKVSCGQVGYDWVMLGAVSSEELLAASERAVDELLDALDAKENRA